jgi:hypothetical protein
MEDHISYPILSQLGSTEKSSKLFYQEYHRSIPLKPKPKKQEKSSLAYLSSMMQTENLLMSKAPSTS